jgi:hypothetical protein
MPWALDSARLQSFMCVHSQISRTSRSDRDAGLHNVDAGELDRGEGESGHIG